MKLFFALLIFVMSVPHFGNAQITSNGSARISLSDQSLIVVSINGRKYDKVARELTVYDLPAGRNTVEIYKFIPNRNGKGGKASLLHRGSFRFNRGYEYDLTYDVSSRKMIVDKYQLEDHYRPSRVASNQQDNLGNIENTTLPEMMEARQFASLSERMQNAESDSRKLELLKSELEAVHFISTAQLNDLLLFFAFDVSKVEAIKTAYPKLSDPANAPILENQLSFEDYREEVRIILKGQ